MICLKPNIEILPRECPNCRSILTVKNFVIPGMRNLADFQCQNCDGEFFGDLPSGQGLYTPQMIDKKSGVVYDDYGVGWFAEWLDESYKNRENTPIKFEIRKFCEVKNKVILLNCLDTLYGHSLLKLLNAQHHIDFQTDFSLIVLIPPFLEWLLPDGVAEAWVVDLPLKNGTKWNDWLANNLNEHLQPFSEVYLSPAFSHPHHEDFDIERFTRTQPFQIEEFNQLTDEPVITFIWREDRLWNSADETGMFQQLKKRLNSNTQIESQQNKIIQFAENLREKFPKLDFAVVGIGQTGNFPAWITDLRLTKLNSESERKWCKRYADSHLVVGVHGSNMLLPSAHSGGVIELLEEERQGNFLQDILFRAGDVREILFRYRFVSHSTTPENLAHLASIMLRFKEFKLLMNSKF